MMREYTTWTSHGEEPHEASSSSYTQQRQYIMEKSRGTVEDGYYFNPSTDILNDAFPFRDGDHENEYFGKDAYDKYQRLRVEARTPIYVGSEHTILDIILKAMRVKGNNYPGSDREVNRILKNMGMGYETIHACEYGCVLYYKDFKDFEHCPACQESRKLGEYTRSVRNSRYPEGCIAEQYVTQECVTYCKLYLNESAMDSSDEVPLYILKVYSPLIKILKGQGSTSYCKELHSLAHMAQSYECFSQCYVNDVKFVVWDRDRKMKTQNFGVMVEDGHVTYYGVIRNIVQVQYANGMSVDLFDCIWFNTDPTERGSIKKDYGLISVDTSTSWYEDWPYCLATLARQVFYLDGLKVGDGWKVVNVVAQRGTYSQRSLARHDESSSDTHSVLISHQDHEDPYQEDMPLHISNDLQPMDPNVDQIPNRARRL
ncbi:hypothetical protein QQ045_012028 [Rhodiola kirilowii]